jgi:cell division protein FtsI (penicillin-binding protein 3)
VFKRIAEATLQYLGVAPNVDAAAPVVVARHEIESSEPSATVAEREEASQPIVSLVADGPAGTMPDLTGLSARDAVRRLMKLKMTARLSGNGFVVSQDPAPGSPIEDGGACRLTLERWPSRRSASASQQ